MDLLKIFLESKPEFDEPHSIDYCYFFEDEVIEKKTFEQFLAEVTYGSLEKDIRITDVTEKIKDDMIDKIKDDILYGIVNLMVVPKSKNPIGKYYQLDWQLKVIEVENSTLFNNNAYFDRNIVKIIISIQKDITKSDEYFKKQINTFIVSGKINEYLRHEVRHFIDYVDGKFVNDKTYTANMESSKADKIKYMSQHREIEAQLISVLSDMEYLYKKLGDGINSPTFETVSSNSKAYEKFMRLILPSKRSKYRTKILHFWFTQLHHDK